MRIEKCDICGLDVGKYGLRELLDYFQQDEVKEVCEDCHKEIREIIANVETVVLPIKRSWIKRMILKMRADK